MVYENEGCRITSRKISNSRKLYSPKIGIFAGEGSSHSWLWFVDIFDRMGFHDIRVIDEDDILNDGIGGLDVLAVSGGDTFAVAEGLGRSGADLIRSFIERGGLYIGACAGAYLVMNSSKPHLNHFNFTAVKITNLSKYLPECRKMEHKFAMAYGCDFIFHPVRETVRLRMTGVPPFPGAACLDAPMYGGPGMIAPENADVLARYDAFTRKTSFLVDREMAGKTLIGRAAAVAVPKGAGRMMLFGPHFEHPGYPEANKLIADTLFWDGCLMPIDKRIKHQTSATLSKSNGKKLIQDVKRELSNSRIVAAGLEMNPVRWLIGAKTYEPEKIRVFIESMWQRIRVLEKCDRIRYRRDEPGLLAACAEDTTRRLRLLKHKLDGSEDTLHQAGSLFHQLHRYTIAFYNLYFKSVCQPI